MSNHFIDLSGSDIELLLTLKIYPPPKKMYMPNVRHLHVVIIFLDKSTKVSDKTTSCSDKQTSIIDASTCWISFFIC